MGERRGDSAYVTLLAMLERVKSLSKWFCSNTESVSGAERSRVETRA